MLHMPRGGVRRAGCDPLRPPLLLAVRLYTWLEPSIEREYSAVFGGGGGGTRGSDSHGDHNKDDYDEGDGGSGPGGRGG
jgi:hypothetical protein